MSNSPDGFTCLYCGHIFKRETYFERHRCKQMVREEEVNSVRGRAAHELYLYWLKSQKRRVNVNVKTFGQSSYFTTFYKFVKWANAVKLPDKQEYIRFMNIKKYPPNMWTTNDVYMQYIEWTDMKWTAEDHFRATYKTLQKIAQAADCPIGEALDQLTPNHVLVYVRARKLSPWVLLRMKGFKRMLQNLTQEQQLLFQETIRPIHWKKVLQDPSKEDENYIIKEAVKAAGL